MNIQFNVMLCKALCQRKQYFYHHFGKGSAQLAYPGLNINRRLHITRIINKPADKKEMILKFLSFLHNVNEVNISINCLLVIGDAKTF